jgi:hypothetical protein
MKVLRQVRNIELNEGNLMADSLFSLSNGTDVSHWFDSDTKDRLMKLNDADFWHQAKEMIKEDNILINY